MKLRITLFILFLAFSATNYAAEKLSIRVGVLAFGTVNWELTALKDLKLLENADFQLKIIPVANPQAGKIALQAGSVDVIVSDWIWVSRLRGTGSDFTFYPYSSTAGVLMVPEQSDIQTLVDLQGKKLAIAGGELDKNWLLLQALGQQKNKIDLNATVEKTYGAPPLLNQQIIRGRVDAVINYWHFAARLETQNYKPVINSKEILQQLGIEQEVPTLGYVFNRKWALQYKKQINAFLKATQMAKNQLCQSDTVWSKVIPLTRVKDSATQIKLRQRYCEGRVKYWGVKQQQAAQAIYSILKTVSDSKLTGKADKLQTGTFWTMNESQ